jgi:hypothetical protein
VSLRLLRRHRSMHLTTTAAARPAVRPNAGVHARLQRDAATRSVVPRLRLPHLPGAGQGKDRSSVWRRDLRPERVLRQRECEWTSELRGARPLPGRSHLQLLYVLGNSRMQRQSKMRRGCRRRRPLSHLTPPTRLYMRVSSNLSRPARPETRLCHLPPAHRTTIGCGSFASADERCKHGTGSMAKMLTSMLVP